MTFGGLCTAQNVGVRVIPQPYVPSGKVFDESSSFMIENLSNLFLEDVDPGMESSDGEIEVTFSLLCKSDVNPEEIEKMMKDPATANIAQRELQNGDFGGQIKVTYLDSGLLAFFFEFITPSVLSD